MKMPPKAPRITLYSSSNCPHCKRLKQWLQHNGQRFQEFDVQRNARAAKAFARLGARSVPVLMVGEQRIDGFDPRRLQQVFGKK